MSDAAVDAFLGRGGDRATRDFLRATKGIENAEDVVGSAPEDDGSSWFGSLAQDVEEIVGRGMDAVGAVAPYLFGPRSRYLPQMSEAAGQFLGNAAEDVSEWGSDFWEDVKGLAQGIGDELTATSWQDLQDADNANADNAWQVYEDVARPAGMIAATPGLPAKVRAAAGLVYAPKFLSDAVNLYEGAPGEGDEDGSDGGIGAVVDGMVVQPLEQLLTDVTHPGQLAEDIFEHPANLWDRVLMPATMVEGGVRGAKRMKEAAQGRYDSAMDALSDMEDNAEAFAPDDTVADVDVTPGESSPIPFVDTGHGVLDEYMADAANQYGVDLNILHKMAQQESEHGRADSNVMQVLDSTGRELGFDDVSDPKQSIYAGAAYLRKMLDAEDGDYAAAIRDYNGGGDPEYLEHVLSQPDYDVSGTRPGGAEGGYDVPAEAAYTLEPGVNHEGFSDLTEQKLRVLDAYYAELTGGDHLDVTSMRDGTHSDPGHANGTAFDVANDALHDDALRAKVIAKAEELGLRAYDEFDRSNWTENTTGDNLHLSDTGSALNARSGGIGRNAWEEYGRQVDEASEEAYASEAAETGMPLTDIEGRELGAEDAPAGLADDVRELVDHSDLPRSEDVNAPAKVDWGEERAGELASLDRMISAAEDERQRLIDDEVRRMEETPGGRGTDVGYTYDAEGNVVGRFSTSRNPQWYQDAYHRLGRAPRRSDLAQLAAENLSKEQEFAQLERQIQQMQEVRRRLAEHPEADGRSVVSAVTSEDRLIYGEKSSGNAPVKLKQTNMQVNRYQVKPMSERAIERNIQRGNQAVKYILREHANGNDATVHGAMHRTDIGYVDFLWGAPGKGAKFKKGYGLAHILAKHGAESGEGILAKIVETIAKGTDIEEQKALHGQGEKRIRIHYDGYTAVLSSARGKDSWLLTGWEDYDRIKQKEAGTHVRGEGNDSTAPTASAPTLTRRGRGGAPASTSTVSQSRTNVNENPLVQGESNAPVKLKPGEHPAPVPDREGRLPTATLGPKKPKGHFKGDRVTREEIFERARELFGTIRTGRTGRGLNGQYDRGADVARTAQYGQFDTMWHEIGHKIDLLLGLTDKAGHTYDAEFERVLDRKYPDGFLNHYRLDEMQPEGIAEFLKEYMHDRAEAKADFPTFYDFWEKEVGKNKDLAARVSEMREMMHVYYKQPLGAQILSTIHSDKPPTIREKIQKAIDNIMINWVDDKWGIKKAEQMVERIIGRKLKPEESAYTYARIAKDRGASAAMRLLTGEDAEAVTKALNKIYGGVLKKSVTFPMVLEKIQKLEKSDKEFLKKNNFKDYQEALSAYLIARRFMEVHDLKAKGRRNYQMPRSYDEYKQFVDSAPQGLKDAAQDIYDLNRSILAIMHHEGMLSDKLYAKLLADHRHYVSLARTFEDDASASLGFGSSDSFINVSNNLKKLTDEGSVRDVKDPLQTIPQNIARSLIAVERNKVAQKFVAHSELYGTGGVIEKVDGNAKPKDSSFNVWQDGKQVTYNTTPEIYQAMQSLKPDGMDNLTHLLLKMPSNVMRAGAVVYNPAFLAKNLGRDQLTAYLNSKYGYKPFYDMVKGMLHLLRKDDMYHEFVTSGALMSAITQDAKTMVPELAKAYAKKGMRSKIFKAINPAVSLSALSEFIEQSTRMGLYGRARKHGATITEATMEARESTLDFGRAGRMGRKWNRYIPFFNAVIQDPVIFMERIRENPARMMKRSAPMIMGSLALYALIQSNDQTAAEYDEMMPYEKNMFWNLPVPKWVSKTGWVRYPKPFGPGFLFGSLPERIADMVKGKDKTGKGMKEWAKGFLEGFNPVSLPPLIQAVYEWQANYSFFRERSIVPQREAKLPEEQQYGPTTSEVAKFIGEHFGLSPRKVDNLGQNLAAGAWTQGNNFIDTLAGRKGRNLNPLKSLTVDPYSAPQSIQDFYDHMDKAESNYYGEKNTKGRPTAKTEYNHKLMNHAQKQMSDLNKKERAAIQKGDQDAVDKINKQQLKVARDALKMYKE